MHDVTLCILYLKRRSMAIKTSQPDHPPAAGLLLMLHAHLRFLYICNLRRGYICNLASPSSPIRRIDNELPRSLRGSSAASTRAGQRYIQTQRAVYVRGGRHQTERGCAPHACPEACSRQDILMALVAAVVTAVATPRYMGGHTHPPQNFLYL